MTKRPSREAYIKRRKKQKRKKVAILAVVAALAVAVVTVAAVLIFSLLSGDSKTVKGTYYLAGTSAYANVYAYDDYEKRLIRTSSSVPRGAEIQVTNETYTENGRTYTIVTYEGDRYYVQSSAIVESLDDIVQETQKYVRTSVTVYQNENDSKIESFIKKGAKLELIGYDYLLEDGSVNMYQIKCDDITGWVFGKYLVDKEDDANAVYQEIYDIHKDRAYGSDLYGGSATDLDWYPYEHPEFEDNPSLKDARSMYLTSASVSKIDDYIKLAVENGVDSIVLDFKSGGLSCPFDIAAELSPTSNANYQYDFDTIYNAVQKIKDADLYLIARIVVFNDTLYGKDHPETCIDSDAANQLWPSAFSRDVWYYNVALAEEIIEKFQPNEIQFDYIRFPEESYAMSSSGNTDFKNEYNESKAEAIQNFVFYACDQIHKYNVYVGIDVFAESVNKYVPAYGQYWPALSNIADVVCAMPYTDHFGTSIDTWSDPYTTVYDWAVSCAARQSEIETPGIARTWLTGYNVPWWRPTVTCDDAYVIEQAKALYDAGVPGGFLLWNGAARMDIYQQLCKGWAYVYPSSGSQQLETTTAPETETDEDTGDGDEDSGDGDGDED